MTRRGGAGTGPLALIVAAQLLVGGSYNMVGVLGLYINFYYIYSGDIRRGSVMEGWAATVFQVAAIGSILAYRRLSASIGKRSTLQVALGVLALGCVAKLVLFQPAHPWLMLAIWAANGAGMAGVSVMMLSMLADAADFEEWRTGTRCEGLFASLLSLAGAVSYSFGVLLSGFILVAVGFDVRLGGAQSPASLQLMRLLYAAVPLAGAAAGAFILRWYPLSADRAYAIRAELEQRRAAGTPDPA